MKNFSSISNKKELIWSSVKDLPDESLYEILSFIVYVRKKTFQPELFKIDYELLNNVLSTKDIRETSHLLEEFDDYKILYPNE